MEPKKNSSGIGSKLRWLLIIDGVLILFVCVMLLVLYTPQMLRLFRYSVSRPPVTSGPIVGEAKTHAIEKGIAIQDIQLLPPRKIFRSGIWVVEIAQRDLKKEMQIKNITIAHRFSGDASYRNPSEFSRLLSRSTVNLLFFSENNPGGFLLFDQQVLIREILVPEHGEDPQDYMLYTVVVKDADSDGRLSSQDNQSLWISDLYGQGLTRVTEENLSVGGISFSENKRKIYIVASLNPNDKTVHREHWKQAVFIYDIKKRELKPLPIDPANFQKARSLLQNNRHDHQ